MHLKHFSTFALVVASSLLSELPSSSSASFSRGGGKVVAFVMASSSSSLDSISTSGGRRSSSKRTKTAMTSGDGDNENENENDNNEGGMEKETNMKDNDNDDDDDNRKKIKKQLPRLPAADPKNTNIPVLKMGDVMRFEDVGPIIINADGTTRLIENWDDMTEKEREVTWRRIAKRNAERRQKLLEQQQAQEQHDKGSNVAEEKTDEET